MTAVKQKAIEEFPELMVRETISSVPPPSSRSGSFIYAKIKM
jgi:hypothetical protein